MNDQNTHSPTDLIPKDLTKVIKENEKNSFFGSKRSSSLYFKFYTPTQRMIMVEDDTFAENTTLLLNLRPDDKKMCVDLVIDAFSIYLSENGFSNKVVSGFNYRLGDFKNEFMASLDYLTSKTKKAIFSNKNFRGTTCAQLNACFSISSDKKDTHFSFTVSQSVYNIEDTRLVKLYKKTFDEAPEISNTFSHSTLITKGF